MSLRFFSFPLWIRNAQWMRGAVLMGWDRTAAVRRQDIFSSSKAARNPPLSRPYYNLTVATNDDDDGVLVIVSLSHLPLLLLLWNGFRKVFIKAQLRGFFPLPAHWPHCLPACLPPLFIYFFIILLDSIISQQRWSVAAAEQKTICFRFTTCGVNGHCQTVRYPLLWLLIARSHQWNNKQRRAISS